ncbi:DEAD/DEAH box helicase [Kribbella sp. NPDC023972]|uniref:DEAD/DEAH box helicase n=1 Tax=Kribbella sp. NPDC023972 TaxID=3154795 RepID=UPI0033FC659B
MAQSLGARVGRAFFGKFDLRDFQCRAIETVLAGDDVLIRAGTGSGKTEAAAAPLTERYLAELDAGQGVVVVYISPTRALANDLLRRLEPVYQLLGLDIGIRHGERNDLAKVTCPQVLITTPESLDVIVGKREPRLQTARAVVLDEIHLLANTQRGLQLGIAVHRLELMVEPRLQVIGLSATVADPEAVWQFFRPAGAAPTVVNQEANVRLIERQIRINVSRADLAERLAKMSASNAKVLVFANSRRECDSLADVLRAESGFADSVYAHHASLSKEQRERVEHDFERGDRGVCVATSTLELGIDIGNIDLIVLFGIPSNWQSLMQRCGRGNRRSPVVEALCVVPPPREDKTLGLRDLLGFQALFRQIDQGVADNALPFALYGAAAQQLVSRVHGDGGAFVGINALSKILEPWWHLDHSETEAILDELVAAEVLKRHPVYHRYGADDGLWEMAKDMRIWSNIPLGSREVELLHGSTTLGRIPATNLMRLQEGRTFAFSGRRWEVEAFYGGVIRVRPTSRRPDTELKFGRRGAPTDPAVVDQIRELLAGGDMATDVVPLESAAALRQALGPLRPFAAADVVPRCARDGEHVYLTFAGSLANQLFAAWFGGDPQRSDDFLLHTPQPVSFTGLPEPEAMLEHIACIEMDEADASEFQRTLPVMLRRLEMQNEWLRRPAHRRTLKRLRIGRQIGMPGDILDLVQR